MFPESAQSRPSARQLLAGRRKQGGNLYMVALFVIVVMGFLASALSRMEWSNQDGLARELLGTQAWFAAHSLNEMALTHLYPLGQSAAVSSVCNDGWAAISAEASSMITQYPGCLAQTQCIPLGELQDEQIFKLESSVTCGSGRYQVERVQDVLVKEAL